MIRLSSKNNWTRKLFIFCTEFYPSSKWKSNFFHWILFFTLSIYATKKICRKTGQNRYSVKYYMYDIYEYKRRIPSFLEFHLEFFCKVFFSLDFFIRTFFKCVNSTENELWKYNIKYIWKIKMNFVLFRFYFSGSYLFILQLAKTNRIFSETMWISWDLTKWNSIDLWKFLSLSSRLKSNLKLIRALITARY